MSEKSNNTKKEAIILAKNYLQTLGFNGFSFQTIADALGIKKASLHYYFSSKEEMGLALINDYEKGHKEWYLKVASLPAKLKLEKMVNLFMKMNERDQHICPLGVLSSDYNTLSTKMKLRLKEYHLLQREWLIKTLNQGKKEHTIRPDLDIKVTADWIMVSLQGGVQIARIRGEKDTLKKMLNSILENIYE